MVVLFLVGFARAHEEPDTGVSFPVDLCEVLPSSTSGVIELGHLHLDDFPTNPSRANDIWGYVSPSGREYAIVGLRDGTAFVEVTNPTNPLLIDYFAGGVSTWRDMKTYQHYAYSVNEEEGGIQVFDLAAIDDGVVFELDSVIEMDVTTAHNIALNEETGFAYLIGPNFGEGGVVAYDLSDPAAPVFAGAWDENYVHDALFISFDEGVFAGREIGFLFAGRHGLIIADVTDKSNMFTLSVTEYDGLAYCHYGWVSEDGQYVFVNDELDERDGLVSTTTTYIFGIDDHIDHTHFEGSFTNGMPSIDHNPMGRDGFLYEANYTSGLRIYDVRDIHNVTEVGFFDTHPATDGLGFSGAWGVYAALPSGVILVSDIQEGLFVFDVSIAISGVGTPGDFDEDGDVDLVDFGMFQLCFTGGGGAATGNCLKGDFDLDGDVDLVDFGSLQLTFTGTCGVAFIEQPVGVSVCNGESIMLEGSATGGQEIVYQWRHSGNCLDDEIQPSLLIDTATPTDSGPYTLTAADACGMVTSKPATVQVNMGPQILFHPNDAADCSGGSVELGVIANSTAGPMTYQWWHNGAPVDGALVDGAGSDTLLIDSLDSDDVGNYWVIVGDQCLEVSSTHVEVSLDDPAFAQHPEDQSVCIGESAVFFASATGIFPLSFQWFKDGEPIEGATSFFLWIELTSEDQAGEYMVRASNPCGTTSSAAAMLAVTTCP
jgi:choice-of-anchor B domain-containing protein